jgi:hypothetical protein
MEDNREIELLNCVIASRIDYCSIQSGENYSKLREATNNYSYYINNCENKTFDEKNKCLKNIFDRSKILIIAAPIEHDVIVVKNNPDFTTIILNKSIVKIWNWISVRVYTHEFTIIITLSLSFLATIFLSK